MVEKTNKQTKKQKTNQKQKKNKKTKNKTKQTKNQKHPPQTKTKTKIQRPIKSTLAIRITNKFLSAPLCPVHISLQHGCVADISIICSTAAQRSALHLKFTSL